MKKTHTYFNDQKVNILSLSWRDINSPKAGGAEVQTHGILKHLNSEKYNVVHLSPMFEGANPDEVIDGVRYIRYGNSITVILCAFFLYIREHFSIDYVIDECNTHRFFTPFYVSKKKRIFLIYQLTREIWYINVKFPINYIGYFLENAMLKIYKNTRTITESQSTKNDLMNVGFPQDGIKIIHIGLNEVIEGCACKKSQKESKPTFIYVGRYSAYKGIDVCIEAFTLVKSKMPDARLWIVGKKDETFVNQYIVPLCKKNDLVLSDNVENGDIVLWGFVDEIKKYELMQRAHLLLFPSLREGWGIIVTEAARLGTPSLVSNAHGCIDAVDFGKAGFICKQRTATAYAGKMLEILNDLPQYTNIQSAAVTFATEFEWNKIVKDVNYYFDDVIRGRE